MSFINEQTSSLADFVTKLDAFLSGTPGWTSDRLVTGSGEWAMSKTGAGFEIRFAAQWDTATPSNLGLYHYHGAAYNVGNPPWAQNDDSGNGAASTSNAALGGARHALVTNSPVQYWAFEDDNYFYAVIEIASPQRFIFLGAGQLVKFGDWTGGEFVYGNRFNGGINNNASIQIGSTHLLDGAAADGQVSNMEEFVATIHAEGLPGQPGAGKWAVHLGNQAAANLGQDRQGTPQDRIHFSWGFRAGPYARNLYRFDGSDLSGHLPFYPIVSCYWRRDTNDLYGPMGYMPDVRGASIKNYVAGDELTIGGDTWVIFPSFRKWPGSGPYTDFSDYQAIAFRKVVA